MPQPSDTRNDSRPPATSRAVSPDAEPLRRRRVAAPSAGPRRRRVLQFLLVFVTIVVFVDALVGEKGFLDTLRARRQHLETAARVEALKRENQRLREDVRRLLDDPRTIESIAREELGLIGPGELLFIVKDR